MPGFRVIVPDLRGYGRSDKPAEVDAYVLPSSRATSWPCSSTPASSGPTSWATTGAPPWRWGLRVAGTCDRVDHLVVLSVGHPATFRRALEQHEKSWYMLLFQFAGVAEQWLSDNNWANFRAWARHPDSRRRHRRTGGHEGL